MRLLGFIAVMTFNNQSNHFIYPFDNIREVYVKRFAHYAKIFNVQLITIHLLMIHDKYNHDVNHNKTNKSATDYDSNNKQTFRVCSYNHKDFAKERRKVIHASK